MPLDIAASNIVDAAERRIMTISSSLSASVAGLNANATRLAAISDNIANSSTFGYKRVEADFQSLVTSSGGGSYSAGGVRASTQRLIDQSGSIISTSNPTDLAVRGRGMFPVTQLTQVEGGNPSPDFLLTTTGSFRTNGDGYLTTDTGLVLLGWPANPDGTVPQFPRDTTDGLDPIQINLNQLTGAPTTRVDISLNLPATETDAGAAGTAQQISIEYFDNLGQSETLLVGFSPDVPTTGETNRWTMTVRDTAQPGVTIGEYTLQFDDARATGGTLLNVTTVSGGAYNATTGSAIVNVAGGPMEVNIGPLGALDGLTQLGNRFQPNAISKDGSAVGNMTGVEVDETGLVIASFDTGITRTIYQVPLVDLPNPNGMVAMDSQTYMPSPESGAFFLYNAGSGPTGSILSFAREESSTDVAGELTDMIQTQRAYSSNATVVRTVDEMLQETTNIKR